MTNINLGPLPLNNNQFTPVSPVGKPAVGLEEVESKDEPLPPVEEGSESAQTLNRRDARDGTEEVGGRRDDEDPNREQIDQEERQEIRELSARDREVRAHEAAHSNVGGQYAGAPQYQFERGPDGVSYAVSGEVPISLPRNSDNPEITLQAAERVKAAALAPADPSPQDLRVAAAADRIALDARAELAQIQAAQRQAEREKRQSALDEQQSEQDKAVEAREEEEREARAAELQAEINRKAAQLNERLITLDNVENEASSGSILDQLI